jgi:hypothetical protein
MSTTNRFLPALAMLGLAAMAAPSHAQLFPVQNDPDVLRCESVNSREVSCRIPDGRIATFEEQHSQAACTRGSTYWINRDTVVVTRGCRASFRLSDGYSTDTAAGRAELRNELSVELARKIRADNNFSSSPTIAIVTDAVRNLSTTQVRYDGTARVSRAGSFWRTVEFTSVYDVRTRDFVSLDYSNAGTDDGDTSERRLLLRTRLDTAIEARLDSDFRNSRNPRFELLTDEQRTLSSTQTAFTGTGRIMVDGSNWEPVTFESVYDWRTDAFTSVSYRRGLDTDGSVTGEMDEDVEAALMTALATVVRNQKGGGYAQVVVNRRFRSVRDGGKVTYTGKFGYSWNDGPWVTRGFEATVNPAGNNVRNVRIYRLAQ